MMAALIEIPYGTQLLITDPNDIAYMTSLFARCTFVKLKNMYSNADGVIPTPFEKITVTISDILVLPEEVKIKDSSEEGSDPL